MAGTKTAWAELELAPTVTRDEHFLAEKIHDGDDALKVLHTHYDPYTKEEERAVRNKIDRRMVLLMLAINGIQFIDKTVRTQHEPPGSWTGWLTSVDDLRGGDVWHYHRGTTRRPGVQSVDQYLLHWISDRSVPDQSSDATLPHWEIPYH
jgi:hypothetical protein